MKRPILTMPAILLLLALFIFAPMVLMGLQNERNAGAALAAGNYLEAAEQFELAAQRLFWKPVLWNEAGDAYFSGIQVEMAINVYEVARDKKVLSADGWHALGVSYLSLDDYQIAAEVLENGVSEYPDYFPLYWVASLAYRYQGDFEKEKAYLQAWLSNEKSETWPYEELYGAEYHYRTSLFLLGDDPTRALDELNTASLLDGRYAPVVETLRTTLNLASLEDDPAEKLILLGRGLGLVGEWQLAASAFDDATQADPESASAWAWLAEAQYQIGEDPLEMFEAAASIDAENVALLSLRSLYYQRRNELDAALADVEKLAGLEPENPQWQISLGNIYAAQGDLPTALTAYERAIDLAPAEPEYRYRLALFSFENRYDMEGMGLSAARRAVILAPDNARYIDTLGLLYFGLERDGEAERQFFRALEKDPEYAAVHLHLGMLYLQRGHRDLAYDSLVNVRELGSDALALDQALRLLDEYFDE